ncbi:dynein light intermediate chain [Kluyveromyces lactis]|uniref:Cytoplasmic dynein intermediate light chain DYN3 n=1 Tax=Kluyveromyces lactis (strain ATCC 8585 / CBS 2359 / DSM 70799 / NBRC 1267 / NRRL Y-1140 / WM37) TaxID=284590 RepID=DYN3_KLULA|nr:uncharacterized protein KLLA0_A10087g [Kluyveromyces lactis]Q6CX98.1 RecName: Full=Cytoplasmic dynein intermediate light chain DYN3; Short=Dynein protein 3 [Kluyveromyces lactis NRRL Y-1140]CAH03029.1 KLLA0A10087p [Kluyveromyces lactis]|eukprot:XP_451441.1 uncharacterized protein KLLA0_A10087g [Kluyveromyces lactis]
MATKLEAFINDLRLQCETNDTTKYVSIVLFCEKETTLKLFFQYIDGIDTNSEPKLAVLSPTLSPVGYYTKEITTEDGWQVILNITCIPPPWKSSSIDLLPSILKSDPEKSSKRFVLLLDWINEDQSYWLEDIEGLFVQLKQVSPETKAAGSVMMLHSDYCKHLENTHTKWSSTAIDFMHQSLRTLALHLKISLYSDLKNSVLAAKSAVGVPLSTEEQKSLIDMVNLENVNVTYGSDSLNKIAMIDENFPLSVYKDNLSTLKHDFSDVIPEIKPRNMGSCAITEPIKPLPDLQSLIPDVQGQLSHLYELQRKNSSLKRVTNQPAVVQDIGQDNTMALNDIASDNNHLQHVPDDDSALDSLVHGIVQRHQIS